MAMRRYAVLAAMACLAACASPWVPNEPLPRAEPAPPPPAAAAPPSIPPPAASGVTLQPVQPAQSTRPSPPSGDIVVPGQVERQVPAPEDPRSTAQRMEDIRAWDQCVMRVQGLAESDPMRPQLETPEDVCRERLGMNSRDAVPDSRRP